MRRRGRDLGGVCVWREVYPFGVFIGQSQALFRVEPVDLVELQLIFG